MFHEGLHSWNTSAIYILQLQGLKISSCRNLTINQLTRIIVKDKLVKQYTFYWNQARDKHIHSGKLDSNQPPSVAPRSGATRELVALRLERVCSVLFMPIHLQMRIDNFFGIAEFRYLYGVDTGNQSRSN